MSDSPVKEKTGEFYNQINCLRIVRARKQDRCIGFGGKHPSKTIPSYPTLETYEETPILIPVDITEEAVESVARKLSGSSVPGGTDSEALQGWLMKFGEDINRLITSVETSVGWLANGSPP